MLLFDSNDGSGDAMIINELIATTEETMRHRTTPFLSQQDDYTRPHDSSVQRKPVFRNRIFAHESLGYSLLAFFLLLVLILIFLAYLGTKFRHRQKKMKLFSIYDIESVMKTSDMSAVSSKYAAMY